MTVLTCEVLPGLDGRAPVGVLDPDGCCPPQLCQIDQCGLICNFISALPAGPLWDRAKAEGLGSYATGDPDVICDGNAGGACASIVNHAVYAARRLIDGLFNALQPALREADPFTAYDTLDTWLDRLGWQDCYDCACRAAGRPIPSPIEVLGPQGIPVCALPTYPDDLQRAVKRGIVIALTRLSVGPRRNLDAINWVIGPLGARLEPVCYRDIHLDPVRCNNDDGTTLCTGEELPDYNCDAATDPYLCTDVDDCPGHDTLGARCGPMMRQWEFCVSAASDILPKPSKLDCTNSQRVTYGNLSWCAPQDCDWVRSYYVPGEGDAAGLPARIYPGVMAAECIVSAMLPPGIKVKLKLCV